MRMRLTIRVLARLGVRLRARGESTKVVPAMWQESHLRQWHGTFMHFLLRGA